MNKLLALVAAVVSVTAVNAATVNWGAVNLYGPDGTSKFSGNVELIAVAAGGSIDKAVVVESFATTTGTVGAHDYNWTTATVGTSYDFYYRLVVGDKELVSEKKEGLAAAVGATTLAWGNQKTYTQTAGNWQSVPEPTSGLLMLLGLAGLALKRKHA